MRVLINLAVANKFLVFSEKDLHLILFVFLHYFGVPSEQRNIALMPKYDFFKLLSFGLSVSLGAIVSKGAVLYIVFVFGCSLMIHHMVVSLDGSRNKISRKHL